MKLPVEIIEHVFRFTSDIHLITHFYKYMSKNTILFLLDNNKEQYQLNNDCKHLLKLLNKLNISWQPPIRLDYWHIQIVFREISTKYYSNRSAE